MTRTTHELTLHIEVSNKQALYASALAHAKKHGLPETQAWEMLNPHGVISVSDCLRMLLDPGVSPDGCNILDSTCT